ncbi:MAG TPA: type IV pilus modification protein PilV [Luteimonas sp.]|nr:type IV pilus modification protein PilV [Luteimonas sp.]
MLTPKPIRSPRAMRGVGLIEVLIAVLVLAIGLLGVAAMQAAALRNSQSALERSQGVVNTYTILDAMRANVDVARNKGYDMPMTCTAPAAGDLAANDRRFWLQTLQANLGSAACGQIACDKNTSICTVTVQWDETRTGGVPNQQFITTTRI